MAPIRLDGTTKAAIAVVGLLFLLAGAGWGYFGDDIFVSTVLAGLAYCF